MGWPNGTLLDDAEGRGAYGTGDGGAGLQPCGGFHREADGGRHSD